MPELPEVETVRRALALHIVGQRVDTVEAHPVKMRRPLDPAALRQGLLGQRLAAPRRRGKYLLLDTEGAGSLLLHLGMSGRLLLSDRTAQRPAHTHLVLGLDSGAELRFADPRRFGLVQWLDPGQEEKERGLASLGLEPFDPDFIGHIPPLLRRSRASIKALLLDQGLIAGVGNIYATEALWRSGIRPSRRGSAIALARLERLVEAVQEVLAEAIAAGGTTIRDYANLAGDAGSFAVNLKAYGREGEPCLNCQTILRRNVIAGRSTAWCPKCQH